MKRAEMEGELDAVGMWRRLGKAVWQKHNNGHKVLNKCGWMNK